MISKLRFKAIARAFVSVPSDSDEQSSLRSALPLIFKLLAPMIFERCGSLADAELVRGSWSNRELVTFFSWRNGSLTFFFGPLFLFILAQGLFSAFDFPMNATWTHCTSTWEFCQVRDVHKINKKLPRELPPGDSLSYEIMTPSWFINFYLKIRFSKQVRRFLRFFNFSFCRC